MLETVEWLRGAAAHVDCAQSCHTIRFLLHIREYRDFGNLRPGSGRPGKHPELDVSGNGN